MAKKQLQNNPHIDRVLAQFLSEIENHDDVPKEVAERFREHLSSGGKINVDTIEEIITG